MESDTVKENPIVEPVGGLLSQVVKDKKTKKKKKLTAKERAKVKSKTQNIKENRITMISISYNRKNLKLRVIKYSKTPKP